MNTKYRILFGLALSFALAIGLTAIAHAGSEGTQVRQLMRLDNAASSLITLEGQLACAAGSIQNESCAGMVLNELNSGRKLNLSNSASAYEILRKGNTRVRIQGTLSNAETLVVKKIQAI